MTATQTYALMEVTQAREVPVCTAAMLHAYRSLGNAIRLEEYPTPVMLDGCAMPVRAVARAREVAA